MRNQKFYVCKTCGNLVGKIDDGRVPMMCCGEVMEELEPNTKEASVEKHLPVYTYNNNVLEVVVGENIHPMSKEHNISWIYVETENGGQRKILKVEGDPKASFCFSDDKPLSVFAYCNLHGLWKSEIKKFLRESLTLFFLFY